MRSTVQRAVVENPNRLRDKPAHRDEARRVDVVGEAALNDAGLHIGVLIFQAFEIVERALGFADFELHALFFDFSLKRRARS